MAGNGDNTKAATGIAGLDDVLRGGFPADRVYLIQGDPGSGKTTLGLQFLLEGHRKGETGMYVSLSETRDEIVAVARSHDWSLDGIRMFEMQQVAPQLSDEAENTLFEPSEVELREIMQRLLGEIEQSKASRVVFDSLSELRLLAQHPLRYRRQILMLKQFFAGKQCTVLFLDDRTAPEDDRQLQSIAHGVIMLEQQASDYGNERRRLRVVKVRGLQPRGGYHELTIVKGGLRVFPRLAASEQPRKFDQTILPSGVADLDALLGGGVDRGTATLIIGPAGSGKSTLALRYALSAVARGEHVVAVRLRRADPDASPAGPRPRARSRGGHRERPFPHQADRSSRDGPGGIRGLGQRGRPRGQDEGHHHRQPQRLPERDARGASAGVAAARAADGAWASAGCRRSC